MTSITFIHTQLLHGSQLELHERTVAVLDALAALCAQEKSSVVAIGLRMGTPIELIIATNDKSPSNTIVDHLTTICSTLKNLSDQTFGLEFPPADARNVSPAINMEDVRLQALYDELFLAVYRYSYDKLELQLAKRWSILEKFCVQYSNWSRNLKQEAREQDAEVNRFFQRMELFQAYSLDFQDTMLDCHRIGWKVEPAQMKLLRNSWSAVIARGKNILDNPLAFATESVSDDYIGPPLRLRRAIEKLVAFHRHMSTLIRFTSSRRMRSTFFSRELKVSPARKGSDPA